MTNFGATSDRCEVCLFGIWMPAKLTALQDSPGEYIAEIKLPDIPDGVRLQISDNAGRTFPPDGPIDVLVTTVWSSEVRGEIPE